MDAEPAAKIAVLIIGAVALNALERGDFKQWAAAKFTNAGDTSGQPNSFATLLGRAVSSPVVGTNLTGALEQSAVTATLVSVGDTRMSQRFAARWVPLVAAARAEGIILTGDAYRSPAQQIALRKAHCANWQTTPASQCHPPTALPGTSRHETGDAIDVHLSGAGGHQSPEYRWLAAHASTFHVYNLPSEAWHWSIDGR